MLGKYVDSGHEKNLNLTTKDTKEHKGHPSPSCFFVFFVV
jgi:hypothetical protein